MREEREGGGDPCVSCVCVRVFVCGILVPCTKEGVQRRRTRRVVRRTNPEHPFDRGVEAKWNRSIGFFFFLARTKIFTFVLSTSLPDDASLMKCRAEREEANEAQTEANSEESREVVIIYNTDPDTKL